MKVFWGVLFQTHMFFPFKCSPISFLYFSLEYSYPWFEVDGRGGCEAGDSIAAEIPEPVPPAPCHGGRGGEALVPTAGEHHWHLCSRGTLWSIHLYVQYSALLHIIVLPHITLLPSKGSGGMLTDFISFYTLPSTVMHHPLHKSLKAAYSFYNVHTETPLIDLMNDALILAKLVWSQLKWVCKPKTKIILMINYFIVFLMDDLLMICC